MHRAHRVLFVSIGLFLLVLSAPLLAKPEDPAKLDLDKEWTRALGKLYFNDYVLGAKGTKAELDQLDASKPEQAKAMRAEMKEAAAAACRAWVLRITLVTSTATPKGMEDALN